MYKCICDIRSAIGYVVVELINIANLCLILICDDIKTYDLSNIVLLIIVFGGISMLPFIIINNFAAVKIIVTDKGLSRKPLIGKTRYIPWENVNKIFYGVVSDFTTGSGEAYIIEYTYGGKTKIQKIFKSKKNWVVLEKLIPKDKLVKDEYKDKF